MFLLGLKCRRDYIFLARSKVQARLQFFKICKKYQALYKQHHFSPSTILTSESLAIETVSNTSKIPACLYGPENLRRSHSNPKVGALKQPKLLYLFKCIYPCIQFRLPCTPQDNFSWVPNCSLGPPGWETKVSSKKFWFGLCEIAWFLCQPIANMRRGVCL